MSSAAGPKPQAQVTEAEEEVPYLRPSRHLLTGHVPDDQSPSKPSNPTSTIFLELAALAGALLLLSRMRKIGYLLGLRKRDD